MSSNNYIEATFKGFQGGQRSRLVGEPWTKFRGPGVGKVARERRLIRSRLAEGFNHRSRPLGRLGRLVV